MFPRNYYSEDPQGIRFTRRQASSFAKGIADDFNPIHDQDAKLFCVPGDLLFALVLSRFGLHRHMRFNFSGMVGDEVSLQFEEGTSEGLSLVDTAGKVYLQVERAGARSTNRDLIEGLTRAYVAFSGHNFPDILVPLMSRQGVMINPARPLVIYSGMEIDLDDIHAPIPTLQLTDSELEVQGKRGKVRLMFELQVGGQPVGHGIKHMEMRGLRPFEPDVAEKMVEAYLLRKQTGLAVQGA